MPCVLATDPTFACIAGYAADILLIGLCCLAFGSGFVTACVILKPEWFR